MLALFTNLKISSKVILFMVVNLTVLVIVNGMTTYSLMQVGEKLTEIAEEDIPLTDAVAGITLNQLEQAINFERAMRYGEHMATDEHAKPLFDKAVQHFNELTLKVDKEIIVVEEMLEGFLVHSSDPELIKEFKYVDTALKTIEAEHADFEHHAVAVFEMLKQGKVAEAEKASEVIEIEEEQLNQELRALEEELQKFTENSALTAEHMEIQALTTLGIGSVVAFALSLLMIFASWKYISIPLGKAMDALIRLSTGDTSVELKVTTKDEVGDLARIIEDFREKTLNLKRTVELQAQNDKEKEIRAKKVEDLLGGFEIKAGEMTSAVASASTQLHQTAQSMSASVGSATEQAGEISTSSERTSANVQTVAVASEEMDASIREISRQVQSVTTASTTVSDKATAANATAEELQDASNKIGEIVKLIQDIAEQTNLLALNATIEAARAGDAGKGFAVVASEVKNLAGQTASATAEIGEQINNVQKISGDVVEVFADIQQAVLGLSDSASGIAAAVEEQSYATKEIAGNMATAAEGTDQIRVNVGEVSQSISEANTASSEVVNTSEMLSDQAEVMNLEVNKFLRNIAAA
ncbi:MAG: methyl-accepting chemotaxis protein [Halopseudomonas aestusnigri]